MIELRSIVFGDNKEKNKDQKVALILFNQENIEDSIKHNVNIQDLSFSTKIIKRQ